MKRVTNIKVLIIIFVLATIVNYLETGSLVETIKPWGIMIGMFLLGVVVIIGLIFLEGWIKVFAAKKRPNFFEDMQSALRSILWPLGFGERHGSFSGTSRNRFGERYLETRYTEYSNDEYSVILTHNITDTEYFIDAGKSKVADEQETPQPDFIVHCDNLRMDKFKNEAIAKLNEWLKEKRIR